MTSLLTNETVPVNLRTASRPLTQGIVHLGFGSFHRAHLALYTAQAAQGGETNWGIFGYTRRNAELVAKLAEQDYLYSVLEISPESAGITIPAIHTGAAVGAEGALETIAHIGDESTKIISLTVTEAGYGLSPTTGQLDLHNPQIAADLAQPDQPTSTIGIIVAGLLARAKTHQKPVTVLSCDNLSNNGDATAAAIHGYAQALPATDAALLTTYLNSVTFPNSMVDRIVPDTEQWHIDQVRDAVGLIDQIPVPAEPFSMWVIEDKFAAGRPAWENHGVIFTDDVAAYETMKLRILNGSHSLMAYLGALDNQPTIPDAWGQPHIAEAITSLIQHEYLPTFTFPAGLDVADYLQSLASRWENTVLADRTNRVGSDGSIKIPQRITEPLKWHTQRGTEPQLLALTVAAYLACIAPLAGYDPGPIAHLMTDPNAQTLKDLAARSATVEEFTALVFSTSGIFAPHVNSNTSFIATVTRQLQQIMTHGVQAAIADALKNN